jgi:hypothetical protein
MWYNHGLGFRLSSANTFFMVDSDRLRKELLTKQIMCEVPDCLAQAIGVLKNGLPAYACQKHYDLYESGGKTADGIIASIKKEVMEVLELHKQIYTDMRQGMEMDQVSVVVEPGKSFMQSLTEKSAGVDDLKKELKIHIQPVVFPF